MSEKIKTKGSNQSNLAKAKQAKNDEFYTQLEDINNELRHYKAHFKNKTVFCNCDDPTWSNFWLYFTLNFEHLGLKKLVSTHYEKELPSYKLECTGQKDLNGELITIKTPLLQNGDFRSPECVEILKASDIVVTNPPFSLFREYITQLMENGKSFIVVGNQNAITYKEIFKFIKSNKVWLGVSPRSMTFVDPNGNRLSVNATWFTNMNHKKRNEEMILFKKYKGNERDYPQYDNYFAINVDKTKEIPLDFEGVMGVPITFMDKYNPEQFEIVNCNDVRKNNKTPFKEHGLIKDKEGVVGTKIVYARILIKNKMLPKEIQS